jgi:hypothetical protein
LKIIWNGNACGENERNKNLKTIIPNADYKTSKTTADCGIFQLLRSMMTNDAICTCEIKSRITMAKAAFNKKQTLFTRKLDLI